MSLADALERAASALPDAGDAIRPANGDPARLLEALDPSAAARVLGWLLGEEPDVGEELAAAWADLPGGHVPLRQLDEARLGKEGRKAWRRILHRLRSRGLVLERSAAAPVVATLPHMEDALEGARLSPTDGSGAQLVVLVEANPAGGARVFEGVLDDERGVLEFQAFSANRSEARRVLRELEARGRFGVVAAPVEAVRARLARVAALQPPDRVLPRAFVEWRGRVAQAPPGTQTPGERVREALPTEAEPGRLRQAVELVEQGEVGPWPPAGERLRAFAERLHGAARSEIVVTDTQRRERIDALLGELLEERFGGEAGERAATRWEETGYVRWRRGEEEVARVCLAAARSFRELPARQNPVARALLERALRPVLDALREEEKASLLVKP